MLDGHAARKPAAGQVINRPPVENRIAAVDLTDSLLISGMIGRREAGTARAFCR
jgi:hypothetical protein